MTTWANTSSFPRIDPSYVTGERFIECCMLQVAMKNQENEIDPLQDSEAIGEWETEDVQPVPIGGTRDRNFQQAWMKDSRKRISVAMVGGIFLIAPMWLMGSAQYSLYIVDCDDCVCGFVWVVDGIDAREAD